MIVNANAPVVQVTITIDNRFDPPDIQMNQSMVCPAEWLAWVLNNCQNGILTAMMLDRAKQNAAAAAAAGQPPNLPPAPETPS